MSSGPELRLADAPGSVPRCFLSSVGMVLASVFSSHLSNLLIHGRSLYARTSGSVEPVLAPGARATMASRPAPRERTKHCSFTSCFLPSTDERVLVLQIFGTDREPEELAAHLLTLPPEQSLPFRQQDGALRLMVGADSEVGGLTYRRRPRVPAGAEGLRGPLERGGTPGGAAETRLRSGRSGPQTTLQPGSAARSRSRPAACAATVALLPRR